MALALSLPRLNGEIEVGLAALAEAEVEEDHKLRLLTGNGIRTSAKNAIQYLYTQDWFLQENDHNKEFLISAVIAIFACRMAGFIVDGDGAITNDGAFIAVDQASPELADTELEAKAIIERGWSKEKMQKAATVIAATKINWWKTNHHTGQGEMSGYTKKVAANTYPGVDIATMTNVIHLAGHWAGTITVLTDLGIEGLKPTRRFINGTGRIRPAADVVLRAVSNPAGTARHYLALALAKKMIASSVIAYCPNAEDFVNIWRECARVRDYPAAYHIGARFLVPDDIHRREDFNDDNARNYLGRLGSFGYYTAKGGTLMKSPALSRAMVQSYDDYSPDFDAVLAKWQISQMKGMKLFTARASIGLRVESYNRLATTFEVQPLDSVLDQLRRVENRGDQEDGGEGDEEEEGAIL